jgi:hypothetical protein
LPEVKHFFTKNKDHNQGLTKTGLVDGGIGLLKYFKLKPDFLINIKNLLRKATINCLNFVKKKYLNYSF